MVAANRLGSSAIDRRKSPIVFESGYWQLRDVTRIIGGVAAGLWQIFVASVSNGHSGHSKIAECRRFVGGGGMGMVDADNDALPLDALRVLQETHCFPGEVMIKVIGHAQEGFLERVLEVMRNGAGMADLPTYRTRTTPNGKYVSLTVEPIFQSAEEVLLLYQRIRVVEGVIMVL